jgi:excisionase family DNA binding protein
VFCQNRKRGGCPRGRLDHFKLYAAPGEWIITDLEGTAADLPAGNEGGADPGKPLTVKEAAARLGISARTVYKLFEAGTLAGSRRGAGRRPRRTNQCTTKSW